MFTISLRSYYKHANYSSSIAMPSSPPTYLDLILWVVDHSQINHPLGTLISHFIKAPTVMVPVFFQTEGIPGGFLLKSVIAGIHLLGNYSCNQKCSSLVTLICRNLCLFFTCKSLQFIDVWWLPCCNCLLKIPIFNGIKIWGMRRPLQDIPFIYFPTKLWLTWRCVWGRCIAGNSNDH